MVSTTGSSRVFNPELNRVSVMIPPICCLIPLVGPELAPPVAAPPILPLTPAAAPPPPVIPVGPRPLPLPLPPGPGSWPLVGWEMEAAE